MDNEHIFEVDYEHGRLRLTVALIFISLTVVAYIILNAVIPARAVNLIAIIGALVISATVTYLIEQQLKVRWPSGKLLHTNDNGVGLSRDNQQIAHVPAVPEARTYYWHFQIRKRTRVPKGWYMVAVGVEHENEFITAYTLMAPETFQQLNESDRFTALEKPSSKRADGQDIRLAGQQKRLHRAEEFRWQEGVEMRNEDFAVFVDELERLYAL